MSDIWQGWDGWRLTTDHAASSYGQPVLVSPDGRAYGPSNIGGNYTQADLAKALNVTPGAIQDRRRRGTLPPFDEGKTWCYKTIKSHLPKEND
jgi:hypothetical protein